MKAVLLFTALVLASSRGHSQVPLLAGNSYTYQFNTLSFQGNSTLGISGPSGAVFLYVDPWFPPDLGPSNSYKVEMFENTPAQPPILSRTITAGSSIYDINY